MSCLIACDTLVRLKKPADTSATPSPASTAADEDQLATPAWRADTRREIAEILGKVQHLIAEVRQVLKEDEGC
jgi:hypothetical protein